MFGKQQCDVLIVGAGPTGLMVALALVQRGVKVRIVDQHWRTGAHSYGLALHPRSLDLLDECGVLPELLEHGRKIDTVNFWDGDEQLGSVSFSELEGKHPFALVLPQSVVEGQLENALIAHKSRVQWNHRLEGLQREPDKIVAEIAHLDRVATGYPIAKSEWEVTKILQLHAKYVVGADGYHSRVREELELGYDRIGPLQSFSVFEFETEQDPGNALHVVFHGDLVSACWPMGANRCRWSFQIGSPEAHTTRLDGLNGFIRERAPWFSPSRGEILWASMVQFDRRLAGGMGADRLWLAGDAVHMTSPVGVQSMNAGLVDASELSWRLGDLLIGDRGPDVLDSYTAERMRELSALIRPDGTRPPEGAAEWVVKRWPEVSSSIPATGEALAALTAQLGSGR